MSGELFTGVSTTVVSGVLRVGNILKNKNIAKANPIQPHTLDFPEGGELLAPPLVDGTEIGDT